LVWLHEHTGIAVAAYQAPVENRLGQGINPQYLTMNARALPATEFADYTTEQPNIVGDLRMSFAVMWSRRQ
jgi:hypothetical protein